MTKAIPWPETLTDAALGADHSTVSRWWSGEKGMPAARCVPSVPPRKIRPEDRRIVK